MLVDESVCCGTTSPVRKNLTRRTIACVFRLEGICERVEACNSSPWESPGICVRLRDRCDCLRVSCDPHLSQCIELDGRIWIGPRIPHGILGHFPRLCYLGESSSGLFLPRAEFEINAQRIRGGGRRFRQIKFSEF